MEEVVYFELNNWFKGRDYPVDGKLAECMEYNQFADNDWCKANKLCVVGEMIDMSYNWCIAAPKSWVEEICPELLSDRMYQYDIWVTSGGKTSREVHAKKYSDFVRYPDELDRVFGRFGRKFPEYTEDNFGFQWLDDEEGEQ